MIEKSNIFEVYQERRGRRRYIYTISLNPGHNVYGEVVKRKGGVEYRDWDANRSKIAAAIMKGCPNLFIRAGDIVLYLGASTGTTVSHVSDMVGHKGFVFALDFAPRVVRDLVFLCEKRKNIAPLLEDAHKPQDYKEKITKQVDVVFQDIAQRDQVSIFLKNVDAFLKPGGYALLALKARSIDVARRPKDIFKEVRAELEKRIVIVPTHV